MITFKSPFMWEGVLFEKNHFCTNEVRIHESEMDILLCVVFFTQACGMDDTGLWLACVFCFVCPPVGGSGQVLHATIFSNRSGFVNFTGLTLRNVLSLCSVGSV